MSEYIEREAAVAKIIELINRSGKYTDYECGADDACYIVNHIPVADVRAVMRGKWIPGERNCPICGESKFKNLDADVWADWMPFYCPNCGADMREIKDG